MPPAAASVVLCLQLQAWSAVPPEDTSDRFYDLKSVQTIHLEIAA